MMNVHNGTENVWIICCIKKTQIFFVSSESPGVVKCSCVPRKAKHNIRNLSVIANENKIGQNNFIIFPFIIIIIIISSSSSSGSGTGSIQPCEYN
jgi:hypothetical protein